MGVERFFGVEVAADQGLDLVDDIEGLIALDVVDEIDTLLEAVRVVVEKDKPLEVVGFGQAVVGDEGEGGLEGGIQQVKVVDLGREITQSHAEDGVVAWGQHGGRLAEEFFVGGVVAGEEFHGVEIGLERLKGGFCV